MLLHILVLANEIQNLIKTIIVILFFCETTCVVASGNHMPRVVCSESHVGSKSVALSGVGKPRRSV